MSELAVSHCYANTKTELKRETEKQLKKRERERQTHTHTHRRADRQRGLGRGEGGGGAHKEGGGINCSTVSKVLVCPTYLSRALLACRLKRSLSAFASGLSSSSPSALQEPSAHTQVGHGINHLTVVPSPSPSFISSASSALFYPIGHLVCPASQFLFLTLQPNSVAVVYAYITIIHLTSRLPWDIYICRRNGFRGLPWDICIHMRHSTNFPASTFSRGYSIVQQSES